jgi:twitching motility two-component system response regulator PilH
VAKILIIDDSSFQRKWIAKTVQSLGHTTVEAIDGQKGLEAVASEQPDCITVDLNMPTMDGLQFLTHLEGSDHTPPVIVLTSDIQQETREQCLRLGARALINKPFQPSQLQEVLADCLDTQE